MKNHGIRPLKHAVFLLTFLTGTQLAHASLTLGYQFNGKGNWSLDAIGGNNSPTGIVQAFVPTGSHVEQAFLYSSLAFGNTSSPTINFDGTLLNPGDFVSRGSNALGLTSYRTDVTAQLQAKIGGGSGTAFDFTVDESNTGAIDGEALVVVYSNPTETERTIAFLDGFSNSGGDTFSVNLGDPLIDPTTPGFEALFSLGIGFGHQPSGQFSNVTVDGRRLTSSAGGEDDGQAVNGGLITIGGLGDSSLNPVDPNVNDGAGPRTDDELYNLALGNGVSSAPFLTTGSTSFTVNTNNPSNDDNIFFAGLNLTARAGVNQPPPPPVDQPPSAVPEPSTYGLIGAAALIGLAIRRRFQKK